jgi:hypothetical protein
MFHARHYIATIQCIMKVTKCGMEDVHTLLVKRLKHGAPSDTGGGRQGAKKKEMRL